MFHGLGKGITMAHFARLDDDNTVTQVIVVSNTDTSDAMGVEKEYIGQAFCERLFGGRWVQTSYNARFRKNYAGLGYRYHEDIDAFVPPRPFASWILDDDTAQWKSPVPVPEDDGMGDPPRRYVWDEATVSWQLIDDDQ